MEGLITTGIFILLCAVIAVPYWRKMTGRRREAEQMREKSAKAGLHEPATLHPKIDLLTCIGCGSCVLACPEDALGIVEGRAAVIHGLRCIGHALCADACPVGAITMGFGSPRQGMEIPYYDEHYETSIERLYIIGELGGMGLIRNAFEQGKKAVEYIASNLPRASGDAYDLVIVGAGPAGISAALTAHFHKLRYLVLEQGTLGGSILHYPRQKLVLTSPAELPLYGKLKFSEISKEDLLSIFTTIVQEYTLQLHTDEKVETIISNAGGFSVGTNQRNYRTLNVALAIGRRGSPRKLGVPGEELAKVAYRLIEAESYTKKQILIVGGGDSAVEAAIALSRQPSNAVTMSYRRDAFVRLKKKNEERIQSLIQSRKVTVMFESEVMEIHAESVRVRSKANEIHTLKNDHVFIFAGGELPSEFLKKVGVKLRTEEIPSLDG